MKNSSVDLENKINETEGKTRLLSGWQLKFVALVAFIWSLFQLWYASPLPFILWFGVFIDVPARALHLGFALFLVFISYPFLSRHRNQKFNLISL